MSARKRARKEKRAREESDKAAREKKEVVGVTWNVRTPAVQGKNGLGHAETLLLRAQMSRCNIVGLQDVRRGGQGSFEASGDTHYSIDFEKGGKHRVRLAVAKRIAEASVTCTPGPINEHLLKVQLSFTGISHVRGCVCSHQVCCRQRQQDIMVHASGDCSIGAAARPSVRPYGRKRPNREEISGWKLGITPCGRTVRVRRFGRQRRTHRPHRRRCGDNNRERSSRPPKVVNNPLMFPKEMRGVLTTSQVAMNIDDSSVR